MSAASGSRAQWYRETYDALAKSYDFDDFPYYANEQRMILELLERHVPYVRVGEERWAVDLGCGTGLHTRWLLDRGYHVVGVDLSERMLAACADSVGSGRDRLRLVHADLVSAELPHARYVVALAFGSVLNHLERWPPFFARLATVLAPDGAALFNVDNVLGLHQILAVAYSQVLRRSRRRSLGDLVARIRHGVSGVALHARLPVETATGMSAFPFTYRSARAIRRLIGTAGLKIVDARGINAFSSLVPALALSESYRTNGGGRGRVAELLGAMDWRLARHLVGWGGLQFFVCRR